MFAHNFTRNSFNSCSLTILGHGHGLMVHSWPSAIKIVFPRKAYRKVCSSGLHTTATRLAAQRRHLVNVVI